MVAEAAKVTKVPLSIRFFGNDMVLYRGDSGRVVMLNAYCPHMGTHLGRNTTSFVVRDGCHVEGDSIRCPYHAWRFGPDGICNEIPYFETIPLTAKVRSWQVVEAQGAIYVWHDPEGLGPEYDPPAIPEWDDPTWVRWKITDLGTMKTHSVEFLDNMADFAHLGPIHGHPSIRFENEIRGHMVWQRNSVYPKNASPDVPFMTTNTHYVGPGLLTSRSKDTKGGGMIERIAHTPEDDGVSHIWHAIMIKSPHGVPTSEEAEQLSSMAESFKAGFVQDFEIWQNKEPCLQPKQLPTDGNFLKVRQWYRQFYFPRAKAAGLLAGVEGIYTVRGAPGLPLNSAHLDGLRDPDTVKYCPS